RCPEDCKWCAQSAHYPSSVATYPLVDRATCLDQAERNRREGISRYSLVTSGRTLTGEALDTVVSYYTDLSARGGLGLCASLGLLDGEAMRRLRRAGVSRYHCNLETSRSHFPSLCSTHTQAQKLTTIALAREAGMEICSGGIIGMGESPRQRIEFALDLRLVRPDSIPVNILVPIPGTPLANSAPLTDEEILDTVAIFRLIHPKVALRFAGGRLNLSPQLQLRAMRMAVNGAIMGDMLTTSGPQIEADKKLVDEAGYKF
ncbi:MAG: biotin synthase BioB, partial [Duncaniella sp.]|nr:biotin synthase BioB [Duncaniella sp.]